jgi:hypothetical protein
MPTEVNDVSGDQPDIGRELAELHDRWAERCKVTHWEDLLRLRKRRRRRADHGAAADTDWLGS